MPPEDHALPLLYLCRHGETGWNAEGRIQGQRDIPLDARGREQAARNGRHLREALGAGAPGFAFLASPMARTAETMRILRTELGLPADGFPTDPRLMELHFGDWQGFTMAELAVRDPAGVEARRRDKWNFVPAGQSAESYERLAQRARPVFEALRGPTIVVAHGGVSRVFLRLFAGLDPAKAAQATIFQDRILKAENGAATWV